MAAPAPSTRAFIVTGATGSMGGALARQLLAEGHAVHAVARDPDSAAAVELARLGARVFPGSFDDAEALAAAAAGCDGVFINTTPTRQDEGAQLRHAANVIAAARQAGARRAVYVSTVHAGAHERFDVWRPDWINAGYWRGKAAIQQMVREAGFPDGWTVLQAGWLMKNWTAPVSRFYFPELASRGVMRSAFGAEAPIALTAEEDVGRVAAAALTQGRFRDETLVVAGDSLTQTQIAARMGAAAGREVRCEAVAEAEEEGLSRTNVLVASQVWQRLDGWVDVSAARGHGVGLTSFEEYLEAHRDAALAAFT